MSQNSSGVKVTIFNLTLTAANTEYSQALVNVTKQLILQCRDAVDVKLSFVSGESGTTFLTLKSGATLILDSMAMGAGDFIYAQTADSGSPVLEIVCIT